MPIEEYPLDVNRLQWTNAAKDLWRRIKLDKPLGPTFSKDSLKADDPVGSASGSPDQTESPSTGTTDEEEAEERLANGLCA